MIFFIKNIYSIKIKDEFIYIEKSIFLIYKYLLLRIFEKLYAHFKCKLLYLYLFLPFILYMYNHKLKFRTL